MQDQRLGERAIAATIVQPRQALRQREPAQERLRHQRAPSPHHQLVRGTVVEHEGGRGRHVSGGCQRHGHLPSRGTRSASIASSPALSRDTPSPMDKLKAIQYFLAAAQSGSLSAAARHARRHVAGRRQAGQRARAELGATLFQRGSRGLQLTADGAQYAEACAPLLAQLQAADDGLRQARQRPQGTLVVGGTPFLIQHCIVPDCPPSMPAIPI
jgi:hypothetical protein